MHMLLFFFVCLIDWLLKKYSAFFSKFHGYKQPTVFLHILYHFLYLGLTDYKKNLKYILLFFKYRFLRIF